MFSDERVERIVNCCWLREACAALLLIGSISGLLVALSVIACGM